MKNGLLLINLGTPSSPKKSAVRKFLREFLTDKRVIDLPALIRYPLVYGTILPFRPKQTAKAYQAIWTNEGSPLFIHSRNLADKLQTRLGPEWKIALGMRYGEPSIAQGLQQLEDCEQLTVVPLYPQYSSAATGSSLDKLMQLVERRNPQPKLTIIRDFYQHPGFIDAQAALIQPLLSEHDYLLFSFHGIPERHLIRIGCSQICAPTCGPSDQINPICYKGQCHNTTRELAKKLDLSEGKYGMAFQSRLGKTPWIKPYTDEILPELIKKGVKRLAIAFPSFVADCLETLEEVGIRAKEQWIALGGERLTLIPCVNDSDFWVNGLIRIISKPHCTVEL
ncbi:ferrochelatase [Legionella nautarum]|uniref:Ferrochelatase n=1 Tax=Legionella nautarum TaxID=45070 RepID=A0A0W0WMW7_9GAMM|nr:ferrochelatase [Legionella nautarum]KTD33671.1 ferrochelatase [Legionella nautarum]